MHNECSNSAVAAWDKIHFPRKITQRFKEKLQKLHKSLQKLDKTSMKLLFQKALQTTAKTVQKLHGACYHPCPSIWLRCQRCKWNWPSKSTLAVAMAPRTRALSSGTGTGAGSLPLEVLVRSTAQCGEVGQGRREYANADPVARCRQSIVPLFVNSPPNPFEIVWVRVGRFGPKLS